jgi:hypothetical protein
MTPKNAHQQTQDAGTPNARARKYHTPRLRSLGRVNAITAVGSNDQKRKKPQG